MAALLPGAPGEDPGGDGLRPFDHSSLEASLAEVLRSADPEASPARRDGAGPDGLTIATHAVPPAPPEAGGAGASRPDPFRTAGGVNHVGLRLPASRPVPAEPRADTAPGRPDPDSLDGPAPSDPAPVSPPAAIPPNLRLLAPPVGADDTGTDDTGTGDTGTYDTGASDTRTGADCAATTATGEMPALDGSGDGAVVAWRPEDDDILPLRRGRRRRGR